MLETIVRSKHNPHVRDHLDQSRRHTPVEPLYPVCPKDMSTGLYDSCINLKEEEKKRKD